MKDADMIAKMALTRELRKRHDELGIDMLVEPVFEMCERRAVHVYVRGGRPMTFAETTPFTVAYNLSNGAVIGSWRFTD